MPKAKPKKISSVSGFVKYLRTSDEDAQAPERSQDAQRRDITRLISMYKLPDLGEYIDNFTGTSSDRTHYQQMLTDARLGKFSHVFTSVPDRFGRDDVEALRAINEMTQLGITVRFASHADLDPANEDDRLYLNILFGMAKREAAVIARRTRGGMISKVMTGGWSWRAPDGYLHKEIRLTELGPEEQLKHAKYKRWVELDPEQGKVWRMAWDLLLTDRYTLEDICEKLDEQGYHMTSGRRFIEVRRSRKDPAGIRIGRVQILSRAFHNWFYAGWAVVENDWVNIAPKTVKGEWTAVVTTEEFEQGLAILARRNYHPMPAKRHFYLLQGMIYLETEDGLRKLTCGKPNANRRRGGVSYYCIPSSSSNYICSHIDAQINAHLAISQVDPELLPAIRRIYLSDVTRYTKDNQRERKIIEARKRKLDEKELNSWRAFTEHGMRPQLYENIAKECEQDRQKLDMLLHALKAERNEQIANLDAALNVVSEIGERFDKCTDEQQRAILLQMVERVVINPEGMVVRVEWKAPFSYLRGLIRNNTDSGKKKPKMARNAKTSGVSAGSLQISRSAPTGPTDLS
jgi:DNA invertase Pin-like site-specific DNA recombinase